MARINDYDDQRDDSRGNQRSGRSFNLGRRGRTAGQATTKDVEGSDLTGMIQKLDTSRGFGFIDGMNGVRYFFHRSACLPSDDVFESLNEGDRVQFDGLPSPKGARAQGVIRLSNQP